jgi:hypothetical protein
MPIQIHTYGAVSSSICTPLHMFGAVAVAQVPLQSVGAVNRKFPIQLKTTTL